MAIDASIPLQVITPDKLMEQSQRQTLNSQNQQLNAAKVANISLDRQNAQIEGQLNQAKMRASQLAEAKSKIDIAGNLIAGAVDQSSYDAAKAKAQSLGLDVSQEPAQYDPAYIKQKTMSLIDAKDRIDLEMKQLDRQFENQKFGETVRHNRASEATAADNADIRSSLADFKMQQAASPSAKPLPVTALKMQNEALQNIGTIGQTNTNIDKIIGDIDSGGLKTDLANRGVSNAANYVGMSTPQSRALASYQANLKKMVNDSLLLAKGVQTEGDAQRAADAILAAPNDTAAVKERLQELKKINERSRDLQKLNVDTIRSNFGKEGFDFTPYEGTQIGAKLQHPNAEKIKAAFQSGKLTEAQARAAIEALK